MGRDENRAVFEDTEKLCKANSKLRECIQKSIENQVLILEKDQVDNGVIQKYEKSANLVVSRKRTYEAASAYKGKKVAVLNFASASNPGGGVVKGASAQEECLCRCSTLFFALSDEKMRDGFYTPHRNAHNPLHNDDIIYTPDVTVFKTDTASPKLMDENDWYKVDVITCAAPNLRNNPTNKYNPGDGNAISISDKELMDIHEKKLKRILDVAVANGAEVVILGAFGCGAFRNNPVTVAVAARNVLPDYFNAFETIEYAVYCRDGDERNYEAFYSALAGLN